MSAKKQVYYALYSDYEDGLVSSLFDTIEELKKGIEEGDYTDIGDEIFDSKVCKVEMLDEYEVSNRIIITQK